jgi:DNA-binding response OmpR family regulator
MTQKKILIADDEKDIVELVAYNLEREGYAVITAFDGRKAWEMINAGSRTSSSST